MINEDGTGKGIINSENETNVSRITSGAGLVIAGTLCCAGPLIASGVVAIPAVGIIGGLGVIVATLVKLFKSS